MPFVKDPIKIVGIDQFNKSLRRLDAEAPKGLRLAFNDAANIIVDEARPKIPRRSGKAQAALRARSTRTRARVVAGSTRAPYLPWLDYGGKVGKNQTIEREFIKGGRYVYPTYYRNVDKITKTMETALLGVIQRAGLSEG
jgi:hypothetical protein